MRADSLTRLLAKIVVDDKGCWLWCGAVSGNGYGVFWLDGLNALAHRASYLLLVGPIPEGLQIDHLCRVRRCVNPAHLEPVTASVNQRRGAGSKPLCKSGHPLSGPNLYIHPSTGQRTCRACHTKWSAEYNERRKAA